MDFQWATPIFHFATAHTAPTRRSIGDRSVEISIPPTGHASDPLASHVSVNDTTCTTQSDYSDHVCHLHSKEACDGSLPPEPELHAHNTSHRTDALQHTCHGFFSRHVHNGVWYSYLCWTFHSHCLLFLHALHSTVRLLMQDSLDISIFPPDCRFKPCPAEAGWINATGSSPLFHFRILSSESSFLKGILLSESLLIILDKSCLNQ